MKQAWTFCEHLDLTRQRVTGLRKGDRTKEPTKQQTIFTLPLPSLVLALRSGGAGAGRHAAGVGAVVAAGAAAGAAGAGGTMMALSAPPSVPDTTMFSTAAATLAAARAALAVAQPCKKTTKQKQPNQILCYYIKL